MVRLHFDHNYVLHSPITSSTSPLATKTSTAGPATNPLPSRRTFFFRSRKVAVGDRELDFGEDADREEERVEDEA
jgi:hypothetical protein